MNPLMQAMNGANNPMNNIQSVINMLKSGNPKQIAMNMMNQNPRFRQFMEQNKGKTPEQVARENGIDLNEIMGQSK